MSVIIPTYNCYPLLEEAIESVFNQTFVDYEVLLIDDGSTDHTQAWASQYEKKICYYRQENQGQAVARNFGARLAKGKFLAFLDSDDLWLPKKLEIQVAALLENPHRSFVFTNGYRLVMSEFLSKEIDTFALPRLSSLYTRPREKLDFDFEFRVHCVPTSSLMIDKEKFIRAGGMPNLRQGEDFVLCSLLLLIGSALYIDEPLIIYRVHQKNISAQVRKRRDSIDKVLHKDLARIEVSKLAQVQGFLPPLAARYCKLPQLARLWLLLYWRIHYGASVKKVLSDLIRYLEI